MLNFPRWLATVTTLAVSLAAASSAPAADKLLKGSNDLNPPGKQSQIIEAGDCSEKVKKHAPNVGFVCMESSDPAADVGSHPTADLGGASERTSSSPKVKAAARTYSFSNTRTFYYGIGGRTYGSINWTKAMYFNGRQGNINQRGVAFSGPPIRQDFRVNTYWGSNHTLQHRTRRIVPSTGRWAGSASMPTFRPFFNHSSNDAHYN
jgi:hypothetical protein